MVPIRRGRFSGYVVFVAVDPFNARLLASHGPHRRPPDRAMISPRRTMGGAAHGDSHCGKQKRWAAWWGGCHHWGVVLAVALLSLATARPVHAQATAYLPLNLEPEMERQVERVLILADEPILKRP